MKEAQAVIVAPASAMQALAPVTETGALINLIERVSRDPGADLDKLARLIELRNQVKAEAAKTAFDAAMTLAQSEMRPVAADANNPQTKSKYASYPALDRAMRPIYTRSGFSLSFNTGDGAPDQYVRVCCRVAHSEGHGRDYHIDMPADGKGAKGGDVMTKTHATGSAVTYGMRYLLKMIFNVAVGEDDDGNGAGGGTITEDQVAALQSLIVEVGADIPRFLKYMKVATLADLPAKQFQSAVAALNQKRKAMS